MGGNNPGEKRPNSPSPTPASKLLSIGLRNSATPQNRWKKIERALDARNSERIHPHPSPWEPGRSFADGRFSPPIGSYKVTIHGHRHRRQPARKGTARILIPRPKTPPPSPPLRQPNPHRQPAADNNPTAAAAVNQPHPTATETKISSGSFTFSSKNDVEDTNPAPTPDAESPNSNILWGAAAAAALGTYTAAAEKRRKERQKAAARSKAAATKKAAKLNEADKAKKDTELPARSGSQKSGHSKIGTPPAPPRP